jgi:sensor histidine kinase YesM
VLSIILSIADQGEVSFKIMQLDTLVCSFFALFVGFRIALKGYRPAKFFLLAWSILLSGAIIFILKDFGILPFNRYTNYALQISSALEAVLLSFALADRINILKKENTQKQEEIIEHLKEKERHLRASQEAELIVERLKKETLLSQFESLKNQVNPHFLFNSLNVLTELIHHNQDKAAKFVGELSDVYRYVLDSKNKEVVELKSELEFIEAFFYLLKIRFSDNIKLTISIKDKRNVMIPPLTLQLLIENAVKHNIISKTEPLLICIYEDNDYLVVKNQLRKKREAQRSSGIGIKNIESRYNFLTEKKIIISDDSDFFTVQIPKLKFTN